jgi:hypothetical protein
MLIFSVLFQIDQMSARRRTIPTVLQIEYIVCFYHFVLGRSCRAAASRSLLPADLVVPTTMLSPKCMPLAHIRRRPCLPSSCDHSTTATNAPSHLCALRSSVLFEDDAAVRRDNRMSRRGAHMYPTRTESTAGAIGMEDALFNHQLNDRIVEGKTKRSMWTNTHARNRTGGVRYSMCLSGSCILPADTWIHPLLLQPPS